MSRPFSGRQGDVFVLEIESIPEKVKPVKPTNGRLVFAYGEATGHHHSVVPSVADAVKLFTDEQGRMFCTTSEGTALVHQTHDPIPLEAGKNYAVIHQNEYSYGEWTRVRD